MRRIAVLTGGGDAPGLNAVIRAVVKTAIGEYGCEVLGVKNGFDGFLDNGGIMPLGLDQVRGILSRGGTILGTANRGNPFARKVIRDGRETIVDMSDQLVENVRMLGIDALITIGGDGTLRAGMEMGEKGVPIIGVPKTIDNDVGGTEITFGFDTAVNTAVEALDKLHTTAEAHHRVMVLELMGRDAGFIALHAGIAGGADVILVPEIPFNYEAVARKVLQRKARGSHFSIVAVSEGAKAIDGEQVFSRAGDQIFVPRLGGIGQKVAEYVEKATGSEARVTVLGHLQRGGTPTAFDRLLGSRYGAEAVRAAAEGHFGNMVCVRSGEVGDMPLSEALSVPKRVDIGGDTVKTARNLGISFGDE